MKKKDTISIGAQVGDEKADKVMNPHVIKLRQLLINNCIGPYSPDIDEFSFVLRIDGKIWYWNFEGCDKLRLSRKGRYITIDIGVPKYKWEKVDSNSIRNYLSECIQEGLNLMIKKLKKSKIEIKEDSIKNDFKKALGEYLTIIDS